MDALRSLIVGAGLSLIFDFLLGCSSTPAFPQLDPSEGWARLSNPPAVEGDILAVADSELKSRYFDRGNTVTWFKKSDSEYLIYIRNEKEYRVLADNEHEYGCMDRTFDFEKIAGVWALQNHGIHMLCVAG
jgi:hypothetical protein